MSIQKGIKMTSRKTQAALSKLASPLPRTSPLPKTPNPALNDFPAAIALIRDGAKMTKLEWKNPEIYILLRNTHLQIHLADGFHDLIVSDGDMMGNDWVVV